MDTLYHYLSLGMGGFLGSVGRYWVAELMLHWMGPRFPAGTLAVNLGGSFLIGILMVLLGHPYLTHPNFRLFFIVGLMGGFTTYSSFSFDILRLMREGESLRALFYVGITLSGGLGLTFLGTLTGQALIRKISY